MAPPYGHYGGNTVLPLRDENPTTRRPVITLAIIVACVVIHLMVSSISGTEPITRSNGQADTIDADLAFTLEYAAVPCEILQNRPLDIDEVERTYGSGDTQACDQQSDGQPVYGGKHVWLAILFSMFLHADFFHLGSNMLVLWIFGNNVEDRVGVIRYIVLYVAAGFAATFAHVAGQPDSSVALVGASGAIAGLMGAYLVWYPDAPIRTLIFIFLKDIKAKWFLAAWFAMQFFTGNDSGVAWLAHVGGFVFGVLIGLIVRQTEKGPPVALREPYRPDPDETWDTTGGIGRGPYERPRRIGLPPQD